MRTVITYGTFDTFHYGHLRLLQRAKALGDLLIVGLSTDEFNAIKGKKSVFNYEERKAMLQAIRCVDVIIPENNWSQKRDDIRRHGANIFVMGDDWKGKFDDLKDVCEEVVYLPRTEEISSTLIKKSLCRKKK